MRFDNTERLGIYKSGLIFTEDLNWIFREQPIADVGIDALIEEAINGNPTGKFLAAQVKTGIGNFYDDGKNLIFYFSRVHYKYWLNLDLPIILIAYIPEDGKCYWQIIHERNVKRTPKQWKLEISKYKILGNSSIPELTKIIYRKEPTDFFTKLINKTLSELEIDLVIEKSRSIQKAKEPLEKINEITQNLVDGQNKFNKNLSFCLENNYNKNHPKVVSTLKTYSKVLNTSSMDFQQELNQFSDFLGEGIAAFEKMLLILAFIGNTDVVNRNFERLTNFEQSIKLLLTGLKVSRDSTLGLTSTSPYLKNEGKKLVETFDLAIYELTTVIDMCQKVGFSLEKLLQQ